jgi:pantoate--beta-alanine ligase
MDIYHTRAEAEAFSEVCRSSGLFTGFVPTMGALHKGHISLVQKALNECDRVIASIFVNPLQFNNREDFEKYPFTPDHDLKMLADAGCHAVFMPSYEEIYASGEVETYDFGHLGEVMEGRYRPGHFSGMAAVVRRLLEAVRTDRAYFGEKDYQQYVIVRKLVAMLGLAVTIVPCPIIREANGLAMSSRNERLSHGARSAASAIFATLNMMRSKGSTLSPSALKEQAVLFLSSDGMLQPEYIEIADTLTLRSVENWSESLSPRAFIAAYIEDVRLIDNMVIFC